MPYFNPCITPSEPDTFKLLYNKFDEVAHLTLGHNNIVNEFMGAMDAIRVKAEAASMKNLQIGRVQLPGRGWVYRRRTKKVPSTQAGTNGVGEGESSHRQQHVEDSPDQRGK